MEEYVGGLIKINKILLTLSGQIQPKKSQLSV